LRNETIFDIIFGADELLCVDLYSLTL